jgi:hypothetical protein
MNVVGKQILPFVFEALNSIEAGLCSFIQTMIYKFLNQASQHTTSCKINAHITDNIKQFYHTLNMK